MRKGNQVTNIKDGIPWRRSLSLLSLVTILIVASTQKIIWRLWLRKRLRTEFNEKKKST